MTPEGRLRRIISPLEQRITRRFGIITNWAKGKLEKFKRQGLAR